MNELERRYTILETDSGPMISESRISVYDILEAEEKGLGFYEICMALELFPIQVEVAQTYLNAHRETLTAELRHIQAIKREREAFYRAKQAEIFARLEALPPNPVRQKMLEIKAKYHNGNGHS